jgi:hypothetical protein
LCAWGGGGGGGGGGEFSGLYFACQLYTIFYHKLSEDNALTDTTRILFSFFFPVAMFPFDKTMTAYGQYLDLLSGSLLSHFSNPYIS